MLHTLGHALIHQGRTEGIEGIMGRIGESQTAQGARLASHKAGRGR